MREAPFQFLCLKSGGKDSCPVQTSVPQLRIKEQLADALSAGPTVLVVRNEDVPSVLAALGDRAVDRGAKHPSVPLARLVSGQKGIPVIRGPYTSAGQTLRSIRTLLLHAVRRGEGGGCIIGVAGPVFDQVWSRSGQGRGVTSSDDVDVTGSSPGGQANLLRMLLHDSEPEDLAGQFVGISPHARVVRQLILRAAKTRQTVLILGDVGTGKDVVAQAIHDLSTGPGNLVHANCITLSAGRFEAALFGEILRSGGRGRPPNETGLWKQARGQGTLYLDEISALSLSQQALVNDAMQSKEFRPLGGEKESLPDAQVVVSSARDLGSLARSGQFLPDLYYRLREFVIYTPSLRDCPEDIPILARVLWSELAGEKGQPLSEKVLAALQPYPWPGNVRELKSVLSSLHTLFGNGKLTPKHVETVMSGQGYAPLPDASSGRSQTRDKDRMRCVRHLLRTEEVVQSLQQTLCPSVKHRGSKGPLLDAPVVETVGRLLAELELLFFNPSLFGTVETYTLVNALKGKVHYYHNLLVSDRESALRYLMDDLANALDTAPAQIRSEINGLLES